MWLETYNIIRMSLETLVVETYVMRLMFEIHVMFLKK